VGHHHLATLTAIAAARKAGGTQVHRIEILLAAAAVVFCAQSPGASNAADPRYPDWPCVQAKVPEISVAAVWDGPPIEQLANNWQNEPRIRDLVIRLSARRTPMDEAQKSIVEFLTGDAAAKAEKGKQLFAGLFETLNSQRNDIMNGLERLARREKELAEQIKSDTSALHALQDKSPPDQARIDELQKKKDADLLGK